MALRPKPGSTVAPSSQSATFLLGQWPDRVGPQERTPGLGQEHSCVMGTVTPPLGSGGGCKSPSVGEKPSGTTWEAEGIGPGVRGLGFE